MQTFLPYPDFKKSAQCLDYRRLGKQRVEAWQIYQALKQGPYKECDGLNHKRFSSITTCPKCKGARKIKTPWYNHPIVQMWKGYEDALLIYGLSMCDEWRNRGYRDTMKERFVKELIRHKNNRYQLRYPEWLISDSMRVCASHRSNLLRKDKKYYSKFKWREKDNLPYVWIK